MFGGYPVMTPSSAMSLESCELPRTKNWICNSWVCSLWEKGNLLAGYEESKAVRDYWGSDMIGTSKLPHLDADIREMDARWTDPCPVL